MYIISMIHLLIYMLTDIYYEWRSIFIFITVKLEQRKTKLKIDFNIKGKCNTNGSYEDKLRELIPGNFC